MKINTIPNIALNIYTAPNKLRLLSAPIKNNQLLCMQLYIRVGSVHESKDERGYAHYLEHLLFKSTPQYPNNSLSSIAADIGAVLNAYTDFDTTCYYLTLPSEHLETGLKILSEMAIHADFSASDVRMERSIILEEIHQYEAEPEMSFVDYIQSNYFDQSPLKYPVLGNRTSLNKASHSKLMAFYKRHYRPQNAFLVVTGDYDDAELKLLFHQYFDCWRMSSEKRHEPVSILPDTFRIFRRTKNEQDMIAIALPELNESHPDSEALHIAIRYLAIGKASRLHKELVEREKICSSVKVSSLSGLFPGISVILSSPNGRNNKASIIRHFYNALQDILIEGVPNEDFRLVQKDIIHNWLYSFDGVENLANLIAAEEFNGDLARISNFGAYIESLNNDILIHAVRKHWDYSRLAVFIQNKNSTSDEIEQLCEAFSRQALPPLSPLSSSNALPSGTCQSASAEQMQSGLPQYHSYVLSNGLKLIYNYQPGRDICGFALSSPLSQLNETKPGLNYFSTALMLYGTQFRSHDEIMRLSREHGFNIRVLHHLDSTLYRGKCHESDLEIVLELLSEIIQQPKFDKSYLQMLKNAAIDSVRRERDYPVSVAYKAWFRKLFGVHNNLYSSTGDIQDIRQISLDDCEAWHHCWQLGQDFALCIVGSLQPSVVLDMVTERFSEGIPTLSIPQHRLCFNPGMFRKSISYKHLDQAIIHVGGFACPAKRIKENSAFHILAHILGGDLSSRLYDILREKMGLAYQTGFDFSSINDLGFWYAYAFCDSQQHKLCLDALLEILNDVVKDGIRAQELESAKNYLVAISRMDNESISFKASGIANLLSLGYDLDYYLQREERIRSCTLEELHQLAKSYLIPQNRQIHVLV
ncbi:MAG: pitrilysin family protein [Candidatus Cloacimonetes bacterium]|nr:pitrilysin family protein [Candidatus Cloacimonadota bacterium]